MTLRIRGRSLPWDVQGTSTANVRLIFLRLQNPALQSDCKLGTPLHNRTAKPNPTPFRLKSDTPASWRVTCPSRPCCHGPVHPAQEHVRIQVFEARIILSISIQAYPHIYVHTSVHAYAYVRTYIHTYIPICIPICMYVCMHVCLYASMYVCTYVCMLYIYIHIHTCTHTYTCINKLCVCYTL